MLNKLNVTLSRRRRLSYHLYGAHWHATGNTNLRWTGQSPQSGTAANGGGTSRVVIPETSFISSRRLGFVNQTQSFWLVGRGAPPVWTLDDVEKVSILVLTAGGPPPSASKRRSCANGVQRIGSCVCTAQFIFNTIGGVPPANWANFWLFIMQIS